MAKICSKCGKKIGYFDNDPIDLGEERFLCDNCISPIKKQLDLIYRTEKSDFPTIKSSIISDCGKLYDETIVNGISNYIERIYQNIFKESNLLDYIENYMLTTGYDFEGYKIKKYIGVISGEVVLGTGFLSENFASVADFFGVESNMFAEKLEEAKDAAIRKLIIKSSEKGGNAIIGVDFDYITFHRNMIGVVANGTSVIVDEIVNN